MSLDAVSADRDRMRQALGQALARFSGVRNVSGMSLVALLCASAFAPLAGSWSAGSLANVVGNVGAEALAGVVMRSLDALRGRDPGEPANGEAIERAAGQLHAALTEAGEQGEALREAACALLGRLEVTRAAVDQASRADEQTRIRIASGLKDLAELSTQFREFATLGGQIREATWPIERMLREDRAEARAAYERLRDHGMMLAQIRDLLERGERATPDAGSARWPGCPYLGLTPFTDQETQIFFGREAAIRELCDQLKDRLEDRLDRSGLLLATGASGAGKSSLLRAGLLPRLAREDVLAPGSRRWPCRVLTPRDDPIQELAACLAGLAGSNPQEVLARLLLNPGRAAQLAGDAVRAAGGEETGAGARLVLIVDQFEELFTLAAQDRHGQAGRFVEALNAMATPVEPAGWPTALVVVSIRGDFLDGASGYDPLKRALARGPFVVGAMTEPELRSTITGPAAEAQLDVEPKLVDEIMREVLRRRRSAQRGRALLPLVSEVMAATWAKREGDRLTLRAYRRAGGVSDAVNKSAQDVYKHLPERLQPVAQAVFLRLTLVTQDGRVVRRPTSHSDLCSATGHPRSDVDAVIKAFAARRLLVLLERDRVEIPHDVLLAAWSDLRDWLDEDRDDRAAYERFCADVQSWHQQDGDRAYLYPGRRLEKLADVRERWEAAPGRYPFLGSEEAMKFLEECEREDSRRSRRRRRVAAGLIALTVLAVGAAVGAGVAAQRARRDEAAVRAETSVAVSRQLAVEALRLDPTDPYTARQLAAAAWSVAPTVQAGQTEAALLDEQRGTVITPDRPIFSVAFSPDGTRIATVGHDGNVRLWDPVTQRQLGAAIPAARNAAVSHVVFSPDGKLLADGSDKGTVSLWSVETHRQVGAAITATGNGTDVLGVAFSPSGRLLATAGGDGTARLWDPVSGRPVGTAIAVTGDGAAVSSVVFSPDGTLLATGDDDGRARLWNVGTHRQVGRTITAATNSSVGAIFNPQGTLLATAGTDGSVRLWDPATQNPVGNPIHATTGFTALGGFNPAGTLLATGGVDGTVQLWDPATQQQIGKDITATSDKSIVWSVSFNPSGTLLATAGGDGVVRLWNPRTQAQIASSVTATGNRSAVSDVAFNPSGTLWATAGNDGNVRLWDPVSQQQIGHDMAAAGNGGPATSLAFSPSGALLATAGGDGSVRLWDPATQQQIGSAIPAAPRGRIVSIAFDRSGTVLATGDDHGSVRLWDPGTHRQIGREIPATADGNPATGVAFSPSGALLATAGGDGSVRLWDQATQQQIGNGIDVHASVSHLAFSPSGTRLATADSDGSVRLFDPATQQQIGAAITPGSSIVWDAAFSPRDAILATADAQGRVRFWNPTTGGPLSAGNGTTGHGGGGVLKVAFNPQGTLLATANGDGTSTLINVLQQKDPHRYLCDEYGLPAAAAWSQYAEAAVTEPNRC